MNELQTVQRLAKDAGAFNAVICNHWAQGGQGAADLAQAVIDATDRSSQFRFLYSLEVSVWGLQAGAIYAVGNLINIKTSLDYS